MQPNFRIFRRGVRSLIRKLIIKPVIYRTFPTNFRLSDLVPVVPAVGGIGGVEANIRDHRWRFYRRGSGGRTCDERQNCDNDFPGRRDRGADLSGGPGLFHQQLFPQQGRRGPFRRDCNRHGSSWQRPFKKGILYYFRDDRVCGVLNWNVWEKIPEARELIAQTGPFSPADFAAPGGAPWRIAF